MFFVANFQIFKICFIYITHDDLINRAPFVLVVAPRVDELHRVIFPRGVAGAVWIEVVGDNQSNSYKSLH